MILRHEPHTGLGGGRNFVIFGVGIGSMGVGHMILGIIFEIMTVIWALYDPPYKKLGFWGGGLWGIS